MTVLTPKTKKNHKNGERVPRNGSQQGIPTSQQDALKSSRPSDAKKNAPVYSNREARRTSKFTTNAQPSPGTAVPNRAIKSRNRSKHPSSPRHRSDDTYNSDDEYGCGFEDKELEQRFLERLQNVRGLQIIEVTGDGACMFRAVAMQVFGSQERHMDVRQHCIEYISRNRDHFSQFITEDFEAYIARKKDPYSHGNHVELQAISEIYGRPIEIYEYDTKPVITFHPITVDANVVGEHPPLMLSYHGNVHYNCVADPAHPNTAPILPIYPNLSGNMNEQVMFKNTVQKSEMTHIEEQMLNDKKKMTDFEGTEQDLLQQVARDSYMDYIRSLESRAIKNEQKLQRVVRKKSPECCIPPKSPVKQDNHVIGSLLPGTSRSPQKRGASYPSLYDEHTEVSMGCKIARNSDSTVSLPAMGINFNRDKYLRSNSTEKTTNEAKELTLSECVISKKKLNDNPKKFHAYSRHPSIVDLPPLATDAIFPPAPVSLDPPRGTSSLYEELLASTVFDDDDANSLSHALALSQQEYYNFSR